MQEIINKIYEIIHTENKLVLVLLLSKHCLETESDLEKKLKPMMVDFHNITRNNPIDYKFVRLCFDKNTMPFPVPITECLYYFAPRNLNPLFMRHGSSMVGMFMQDMQVVNKMIKDDISYEDSLKQIMENDNHYKETEKMFEEEEKQELPPTSKMLRGFAKEIWNSAKAAGKGLPVLVPVEVAADRYSICEGCPKLTNEFRCMECGCFMKKKTQLGQSSCPLGKWDKFNKE